jgi:imidazolonepropionase
MTTALPGTTSGIAFAPRMLTLADASDAMVLDAALAWHDGVITYAGPRDGLPADAAPADAPVHRCEDGLITPGLVDCHTHLVFAGERIGDYAARLGGESYEAIARRGGGILSTVRATRTASDEALLAASLPRAAALRADGVTTLEIKSGYGLSLDDERKMLRVARRIGERLGIGVRTTFLGAHAVPPEFAGQPSAYIDAAIAWLGQLHGEGLVDAVDAFRERIGFGAEDTARMFAAARALGLPVKLHADQLSDGDGAALVARFDGLSADHVEYTSAEGIVAMAHAGTVAVLLPAAFLMLGEPRRPPVQAFRDAGVPMAVATDCNPGTAPILSLRLAMALACMQFGLTPLEALRGATVHAARALGLTDRGVLRAGLRADFVLWNAQQPAELGYWLGGQLARGVWAGGRRVA